MAESSAPPSLDSAPENLRFSRRGRDHRRDFKPMIRKLLAAILGAVLVLLTFGETFVQIAAASSRHLHLRSRFEADGVTPTTAAAEAMERVAPVTSAPEPRAPVVSDQPPAGTPFPVPAPAEVSSACPRDMVLVEGEYCTNVFQPCVRWLDDEKLPFARCSEFQNPFALHWNSGQAALLHRPL